MKLLVLMLSIFITACAHLPPDIKDPPQPDLAYQDALMNIKNLKQTPIRWGGVIVEVDNLQDSSLVQVLYYPLSCRGRPQTENEPLGRFVFKTPDFLDPAIYTKNRLVTVAGALSGVIERKISEKRLSLPLVAATTIHLWPLQARDFYGQVGFGFYHSPWWFHHRFNGPFWWPYHRFYGPFW